MKFSRSSRLIRSKAKREPRKKFIIFCEGQRTEPAYFQALKFLLRDTLIEIETTDQNGVPVTLAQAAAKEAKKLGLNKVRKSGGNSFELGDEIWVVFDIDTHPNLGDAIQICRDNNIGIGRSNPCFEVWLVLHLADYNKPCSSIEIQRHLESLDGNYTRKKRKIPNCEQLLKNLKLAEDRATKLIAKREEERCPFGAPSTTVHTLTQRIQDAAAAFRGAPT